MAIVTGSTMGIGAAVARRFAAEGARVVINSHVDDAAAQALREALGGARSLFVQADITDSAAMEYSNNLLVKEDHYQSGIGTGLTLANRIAYTNNANGDPESVKYYEKQQANMLLSAEIKLTYDDKTNPLNLGNDGLAVNGLVMKHNFTKEEIIDASNPSGNLTVTFVYTYNSKGSPSSATYSSVPTGSSGKISYYYQ